MTRYLTHREAAQALLDGKTLHRGNKESPVYGAVLDLSPEYINALSPYRLAPEPPRRITVNGIDVPAPETEALKLGEQYFEARPSHVEWTRSHSWDGGDFDVHVLHRGLIHKTEAAAVAHAKAMVRVTE